MLLLLLLASLAKAEFLTPVLDQEGVLLPALCQEDTVLSCNLVNIDLACLHDSSLVFNGATLNFLDQPGNNTFTFSSEDGDEAIFTVDHQLGAVWGHAELADGRDFVIEPSLDNCNGCHVVIEEDIKAFPNDNPLTPPESNTASTRGFHELLQKGKVDKTTIVTYTVMIYYTPEVKNAVDDVRALADQVVATTNQGYINSKIPIRVALHCLEETAKPEAYFTTTSISTALNAFHEYKGGAGWFPDNNLRGSADAAAIIVKESKWCGLAWMPHNPVSNYMVSMTRLDCALSGYTFGHELSHNFGNSHDKYDLGQVEPFAQGYHVPGTKFKTIMAYSRHQQPDNNVRINYYSNPNVKIQGVPTGKEGEANAARRITETRFAVAGTGDESETCSHGQETGETGGNGGTGEPAGAQGVVSSPNFPGNYPNEFQTTETIQVDAGLVLKLEFTSFDVEYHDACMYDFLAITEKENILLEKHCGSSLPPVIISSTNKVNLRFETDWSVTDKGWKLKWTAIKPSSNA